MHKYVAIFIKYSRFEKINILFDSLPCFDEKFSFRTDGQTKQFLEQILLK